MNVEEKEKEEEEGKNRREERREEEEKNPSLSQRTSMFNEPLIANWKKEKITNSTNSGS